MSNSKKAYKEFCRDNDVPLFYQYEWYQALNGDEWEVALAEKNGNVIGFLPYILTKKRTFVLIRPPFLTPYQGPHIVYPRDQKYTSRLSHEVEVMEILLDKLPAIDSFEQKFHPVITNWLPFYWAGFGQTTHYTYIIKQIKEQERVFADFKENIRREIRKAEKQLKIEASDDIHALFELKKSVYSEKGEEYPIPEDKLLGAFNYVKQSECGELLVAKDETGNVHSMLFYVWDKESAYYLHGGTHSAYKTSGSMSLLLWESIKRSSKFVDQFNFEGSMTASIERYFRAFGGEQTPYFRISRTDSKLLKLLKH